MSQPTETPAAPQAGATPTGTPVPQLPETETVEGEKFDATRAMALIEKLRGEIKELKPKAKQAEDLATAEQKRKEAEMTELQKLQTALDKATADLKASRLSEMRHTVAAKLSLPAVFIDRLVGETPEAIEEDAQKILAALPKAPKMPMVGPTNPGPGASQGETTAQALARIHGQNVDVFSPAWIKEHGGGVIIKGDLTAKE